MTSGIHKNDRGVFGAGGGHTREAVPLKDTCIRRIITHENTLE